MPKKRQWTRKERRMLIELWPTVVSHKRLAQHFGTSIAAVNAEARRIVKLRARYAERREVAEQLLASPRYRL